MTKRRRRSAEASLPMSDKLTFKVAREQQRALLAALAASQTVRLDLSRVAELDTAGVQLLLAARRYAEQSGKSLLLESASPAVMEILELLRLKTHLLGVSEPAEQP